MEGADEFNPFYCKSYKPFYQLRERGDINPGSAITVLRPSNPFDDTYIVTKDGMLEHIAAGDGEAQEDLFDPKDVLSEEKAPDGWEISRLS